MWWGDIEGAHAYRPRQDFTHLPIVQGLLPSLRRAKVGGPQKMATSQGGLLSIMVENLHGNIMLSFSSYAPSSTASCTAVASV